MLGRAVSEARPGDRIQMEPIAENAEQHNSIVYAGDDDAIMLAFQTMLEKLVQSNAAVMDDGRIDIVLQIVRNNRGGVRRKLETLLNDEVLRKKARFLHVPQNTDNPLFFAISLPSLMDPFLSEGQNIL